MNIKFPQMLPSYWVAAQLADSQEGLCSMKLDTSLFSYKLMPRPIGKAILQRKNIVACHTKAWIAESLQTSIARQQPARKVTDITHVPTATKMKCSRWWLIFSSPRDYKREATVSSSFRLRQFGAVHDKGSEEFRPCSRAPDKTPAFVW
jgi:hypothetical protein